MKISVYATMVGMFLVLLMGTLVTKTESGRGCGDDWPLCHGKFIPAYTIESMIEYSHRFVAGVVGLLILITVILVFMATNRKDARWYAAGGFFFTFLQAILGAMAVKWPQSSSVLALHFGFSLLAFSFCLLLYLVVKGRSTAPSMIRMSPRLKLAIWIVAIYCYGVVYLGAFVRHTKAVGGCVGWPLCNGQVIPDLTLGATAIVFAHRLAALVFFICVILLWRMAGRQFGRAGAVYATATRVVVFTVLQVLSGALVTYSIGHEAYLFASLLHTVLISVLFGFLSYMTVLTLQSDQPKENANV
jgi:cytochrome c oxidase assembly protein subunit 15